MKEPVWIDLADSLVLHEALISRFGGLPGIRDARLLDSAINRPRQLFSYGKPSLFQLAAAYAFGISRNHPFLDGNKRMAFMTAAVFLEINGVALLSPEEDVVTRTVALAAGESQEEDYALWLKGSCQPKK
jgi:death-on-curing protein